MSRRSWCLRRRLTTPATDGRIRTYGCELLPVAWQIVTRASAERTVCVVRLAAAWVMSTGTAAGPRIVTTPIPVVRDVIAIPVSADAAPAASDDADPLDMHRPPPANA